MGRLQYLPLCRRTPYHYTAEVVLELTEKQAKGRSDITQTRSFHLLAIVVNAEKTEGD